MSQTQTDDRNYPFWPANFMQSPFHIVGRGIASMLADVGINQIPETSPLEIPVKMIPKPRVNVPSPDSVGYSEAKGQVSSPLMAMLMQPAQPAKTIAESAKEAQ